MPPSKISIDSDALIWYLRGQHDVAVKIEHFISTNVFLVASAIVVLEVLRGMRSEETALTRLLLDSLQVIPVDEVVIEEAYRLYSTQRSFGKTIPFNDSIVAATAMVAHAPLLTYNTKHYPKAALL